MSLFDQWFSSSNLKKIYDYEKRKGNQIETRFESFYADVNLKAWEIQEIVKERSKKYKELWQRKKQKLDFTSLNEDINQLNKDVDELKEEKDDLISWVLDIVSSNINTKWFLLTLNKEFNVKTQKYVYVVDGHEGFYCLKQLQRNINQIYKVKQADRYSIVSWLKCTLNDKMEKRIIKLDIASFYENISFDWIIEKIKNDGLLNYVSQKMLNDINENYKNLSWNIKWLPRWLGISAYLSELYLRDFDNQMRDLEGIYFYARYVDDIIIVSEKNDIDFVSRVKWMLQIIWLKLNDLKTKHIEYPINLSDSIDYLWYNFNFDPTTKWLHVDLSSKKLTRYKDKIDIAFHNYKFHNLSEKKAKNLLLKRLRYLTSNIRLLWRKKNVKSWIYYSSSLITSDKSLLELDSYLRSKILPTFPSFLQSKIQEFSFKRGFYYKKFYLLKNKKYFTDHSGMPIELKEDQFKRVIKKWKYV